MFTCSVIVICGRLLQCNILHTYPCNICGDLFAVEQEAQAQRRVGSIADYDPMNEQFGSIAQPPGYMPPNQSQQRSDWVETIPEPKRTGQYRDSAV